MSQQTSELTLEPLENERLANLCGQFDEHLRLIERRLGVEIGNRGNVFTLAGSRAARDAAGSHNAPTRSSVRITGYLSPASFGVSGSQATP